MRTQLALACAALVLVAPTAHAGALATKHTLTLVLDRNGQAEVDLPEVNFDDEDLFPSIAETKTGIVGFAFEREGEDPDRGERDWILGSNARIDGDGTAGMVVSFRHANDKTPPLKAGRYLLSVTVAGGGSSRVVLPLTGLKHDAVVRPVDRHQVRGTGSAKRLDKVGAVGVVGGDETISKTKVARAWAISALLLEFQGTNAGSMDACISQPESSCTSPVALMTDGFSAFPAGIDYNAIYTPSQVPNARLRAMQQYTGAASAGQVWGHGILIPAPLPRR